MAGVFRFSNPVSDIGKLIQTYRSIYEHFYPLTQNGEYFDHKDASKFLATKGLASSQGAIGAEAVRRSRRADTSRDPLYNQHKMYSEIFRMLGWYEPGSMRTNFNLPEYGSYIADCPDDIAANLFEINILHIVSPNPLTSIRGGNILRPFPLMLKMMNRLDGCLSRNEMILAVLACQNDRTPNYVEDTVDYIKELRSKDHEAVYKEMKKLMRAVNVNSDDVLPNYTRFPLAAIKWTGWVEKTTTSDFYGNTSTEVRQLTDKGKSVAERMNKAIDIRFQDLQNYDIDEQAAFSAWSNLYHLDKAGFDISDMECAVAKVEAIGARIFKDFGITRESELLYFGYQEAPRDILKYADDLIEEL